jgi:hypothetical protein
MHQHNLCSGVCAIVFAAATAVTPVTANADYQFCGTDAAANTIRWNGPSTTLTVASNGWPQGTPWFDDVAAQVAIQNVWSGFDFTTAIGDGSWQGGRNDLIYVNGPNGTFPTAFAVTNTFYENICGGVTPPCCVGSDPSNIVEADIVVYINNSLGNINWFSGPESRIVNQTDFDRTRVSDRNVLAHEMLHAIGIRHTSSSAIAGHTRITSNYPSSGWWDNGTFEILAFDVRDLRRVYGGSSSGIGSMYVNNLQPWASPAGSVVPLSWDPGTTTSDSFPRNRTPIAGQANNRVRRGQTMDFRFCAGNRAAASYTEALNVFLSTNATLDGADPAVAAISLSWPAVNSFCGQQSFTIPNTVPNGTYNVFVRLGGSTGANVSGRTAIINRQIVVID